MTQESRAAAVAGSLTEAISQRGDLPPWQVKASDDLYPSPSNVPTLHVVEHQGYVRIVATWPLWMSEQVPDLERLLRSVDLEPGHGTSSYSNSKGASAMITIHNRKAA